jgi:hypothetical protein
VHYPVTSDSAALVVYSIGTAAWSAAFLEAWRRRESILAHYWGVALLPVDEAVRPDFVGVPKYSVWIGGTEPVTRARDKRLRAVLGVLIVVFGLAATAGVAVGMVLQRTKFYAVMLPTDNVPPHPGWLSGGAISLGAAAALAAAGMEAVYTWMTRWIVDFENYRTQARSWTKKQHSLLRFDLSAVVFWPIPECK